MVPKHLWRFPTKEAVDRLAAHFALPNTPDMQDWEWEVADPTRIAEFMDYYALTDTSDDERFVLMEMLLQSFEESDRLLESDPDWRRLLRVLEQRIALHIYTVWYWGERDDGAPFDQHFRVTPFLHAILVRHRPRFDQSIPVE